MLELNRRSLKIGEVLHFTLDPDEPVMLPTPAPYGIYRKTDEGLEQITQFGVTQNTIIVRDSKTWTWTAETKETDVIELEEERRVIEYPEVKPGQYVLKFHTMDETLEEEFRVLD